MTDGPTRDYTDSQIKHLREYFREQVERLREVINTRLDKDDEALQLWAAEMHRRLDNLNHEQARLAADRERYLPRELAESWRRDDLAWRGEVNKVLAGHHGEERGVGVAWMIAAMVVTWAIALVAVLWK